MRRKAKPDLWRAGLAENTENRGWFFLSSPRRQVNLLRLLSVIKFRNVIIDGIALAGWPKCPWLSRLVDRLTVLADALAEKSGVRA
jgi:hypothetical protein